MAEKKLYDLVSNANKRIAKINKDFIPVTVKSVADMYSNIIWEKGTRRQGQIKNFYEARVGLDDRYKDIFTYEMYKEQVKDLMNEDFPEPLGPNKITLHLLTFNDLEFDGMNIALSLRSLNDKIFLPNKLILLYLKL